MRKIMNLKYKLLSVFLIGLIICNVSNTLAQEVLTPQELLKIKNTGNAQISPDGKEILYTISTPRTANEKPGGAYVELFKVNIETGKISKLISGKFNVSSPQWLPSGDMISFLFKENKDVTQVWMIPASGGEKTRLTNSETSVSSYKWRPGVNQIGYLASTPETEHEKDLKSRGYGFIFYEENLKNNNLYLATFDNNWKLLNTKQVPGKKTVWDFAFSPDGKKIAQVCLIKI